MSEIDNANPALPGYPPRGAEPWDGRRERLPLILLFLAALAVRLPNSGGDLWLDELATLTSHVRLPFREIFTTFISANQHVLYSLSSRVCVVLLGESAFSVRLPAILFGAAGAPALYFLARMVASRREALAAAIILTFSYHHAYFSQSARGYTGYLLFSILSTAFLFRGLARDQKSDWRGFVIATVANLYMHLNGVFFLAGQVGGCVLLHGPRALRDARARARLTRVIVFAAVAALLAGLLYAPIVRSMFHFFTTEDRNVGWMPSLALAKIMLRDAAPGALGFAAVVAGLVVAIAGFVSLARTAPLFLATMILPLVAGLGVIFAMGVGTYPRFFLIIVPFGLIIAVRGLGVLTDAGARAITRGDEARRARTAHVAFAVLAAMATLAGAARLPTLYSLPKQDYSGAIAYVHAQRAPGDLIVAAYMAQVGTQFYEPAALSARTAADLEAILSRGEPIWLIGTLEADMRDRAPDLAAIIDARFREMRRFPGIIGDGAMVVWKTTAP
ncbi:MAG: glycosyltransferase family 39 protein [bacterium]